MLPKYYIKIIKIIGSFENFLTTTTRKELSNNIVKALNIFFHAWVVLLFRVNSVPDRDCGLLGYKVKVPFNIYQITLQLHVVLQIDVRTALCTA